MALSFSVGALNQQLDALAGLLDGGYLCVYAGPRPASPDVPVGPQKQLAQVRFSNRAFRAAKNGRLRARDIEADNDALGGAESAWYRIYKRDGLTGVIDGDVGTDASADLVLRRTYIDPHARFSISDYELRPSGQV